MSSQRTHGATREERKERTCTCVSAPACRWVQHKAPVRIRTEASCFVVWSQTSDRVDLVCLRAFWPLGGLELHSLALIERPESGRLDRAVVDKNVRTAAVHGNEAVALFGIEPLNGSLRHETSPSICIRSRTSRPRHAVGRRVFLTPTQSAGRSTNHDNRPLATASLACHRSLRNVNPA